MTDQQWESIARSLAGLSAQDKRELVDHILSSIREEPSVPDRPAQQRETLARLCENIDSMPAVAHSDGLTNRDHDRILYSR